ncbi:TPA: FctA domain-containing protein [Streptococcus pyogenes]
MKKNKLLLATAILATALGTASLNQNVKAETAGVVTGKSLQVTKTMTYDDEEVLMPETAFTFTIEPDMTASGKEGDLDIKNGIVEGLDKQVTVKYKNTDKTSQKTKIAQFDFSKVKFPAIGVYRYMVSEKNDKKDGIRYDDKKWTVDVYVGNKANNEEGFEVLYIVSKEGTSSTKNQLNLQTLLKLLP